jgi:uncharacterized delta-60 repeat protein
MKNTIKNVLIFVVTVVVINLQTQNATAAWGDYDTGFGFLGAAIDTPTDHYPTSVAVQPDGKILVTGYRLLSTGRLRFFLRRYLSNGQIDTSFGNNGAAVSNTLIATNGDYRGVSIVVQPDGKIAVAGFGNGYYGVWRFTSSGNGDTTFGSTGYRSLSNYQGSVSPTITLQNSKLIVGVTKSQTGVFVLRLNTNGTLDTTFGSQGEAIVNVLLTNFYVLVENESGKITIGGGSLLNSYRATGERLLPDGQKDTSFVLTNEYACCGAPGGFIRLSNQKYVFQFTQPAYPQYGIFNEVRRLLEIESSGALSSTVLYQSIAPSDNGCPNVLAQQQDGKVIATGTDRLFRFNANLDTNTAEVNFCSSFSNLTNKTRGVLQAGDKMIVAGRYNNNLTLVRTIPN